MTPIDKEACVWCLRAQTSDMKPEDERELRVWLVASRDHSRAYLRARRVWRYSGRLTDDPQMRAELNAARHRLGHPPLKRVTQWYKVLVTRRHYDRVIAPQIADIQHEYAEARRAGKDWLARWILARGYASLIPKPLWLWAWALVTRAFDGLFRT